MDASMRGRRFSTTEWLILAVAAMGFAFDIYELLMAPLILPSAVVELKQVARGSTEYRQELEHWKGLLLFVPALVGGFFGMIGGYLTDRLGRRRVLVWSILLYAFSSVAAGFSTSLEMLLFFRCTTLIGVCVEFVAAVAWLAELFPDPKTREKVLGFTQAFSSVGGLMVTGANRLAIQFADQLPAIQGGHAAWRYTLISGLIPALPLIVIRPFLPESPAWARMKAEGSMRKRPSFLALFSPQYRRTTIVTALLFACSYGAAFGAIQHLPSIVRGIPEVSVLAPGQQETAANTVQLWQELGGLAGRCVLAVLVMVFISQRRLLRVFQIPGLIIIPLVFFYPARDNLELLKWGVFLAGFLTVAQFSFWGNYLPRVYPTHLRGTGESFAANVGGRMLGTSAAMVTTTLAGYLDASRPLAVAASIVVFLVYAIGLTASFWLPEPDRRELPE